MINNDKRIVITMTEVVFIHLNPPLASIPERQATDERDTRGVTLKKVMRILGSLMAKVRDVVGMMTDIVKKVQAGREELVVPVTSEMEIVAEVTTDLVMTDNERGTTDMIEGTKIDFGRGTEIGNVTERDLETLGRLSREEMLGRNGVLGSEAFINVMTKLEELHLGKVGLTSRMAQTGVRSPDQAETRVEKGGKEQRMALPIRGMLISC